MLAKLKLAATVVALLIVVIVVFQNTDSVTVRLLTWNASMPQAVALFAATVIGFAAGAVTASVWLRRR
ncbi:MAG: LapA family protein [Planctomycetota bacterium]|nr:MAG: LapA family protein [Planctomycetota bacterium]